MYDKDSEKREKIANRAWLYYRLSREDDPERNSLENQRNILVDYAQKHNLEIIGESFDDGVSGMHFKRDGFEQLMDAVDKKLVDIVLVKDLSRFGRHKIMTAMHIEELAKLNVRVISVTENLDTLDENNDSVIGFKQLFNDYYSKDLSRKIRYGYEQKFKQGFVIHPPYGYIKDKNTSEIFIDELAAINVRIIFKMYLQGENFTKIAEFLTEIKRATPSKTQNDWSANTVKNILKNRAYIGVLDCGKNRRLDNPEFIHEDYYPKIIDDQLFNKVQNMLANNSHPVSKPVKKKYSGLLYCYDCSELCYSVSRKEGIYYVCKSYHKFGNTVCGSHLISEVSLEEQIKEYFQSLASTINKKVTVLDKELTLLKRRSSEKYSKEKDLLKSKDETQTILNMYENFLPEMPEIHDHIQQIIDKKKKELKDITDALNAPTNKITAIKKAISNLKELNKQIAKLLSNDVIILEDILKIIYRISLKVDENGDTLAHLELKKAYYELVFVEILQ